MIRQNADLLLLPAITQRLKAEAEFEGGPALYWALLVAADGQQRRVQNPPDLPGPAADQLMFGLDMGGALNRHLHHDGAWIVGFTDPLSRPTVLDQWTNFGRFFFLWVDQDADPQFTLECDDHFADVLMRGPDHWLGQAETAWQKWRHQMREVLDPKARALATFKRAQGQQAPSAKH